MSRKIGLLISLCCLALCSATTPAQTSNSDTPLDPASRETITIGSFGALGNGTSEDGPALQAAAQSGAIVLFPRGIYLSSRQLLFRSGTCFVGESASGSIIKLVGNPDGFDKFFAGDGVSNVELKRLTIDTDKARNLHPISALFFNAQREGENIHLTNITVPGSRQAGLAVSNSAGVVIESCAIQDTEGADAIRISHCSQVTITKNRVSGMDRLRHDRRGIQIGSSKHVIATDNQVSDIPNGVYAFDLGGTSDAVMEGNSVMNCGSGIDLEGGSQHIRIHRNHLVGRAWPHGSNLGIYCINGKVSDIRMVDNDFKNFYNGIRVEGGHNIIVEANRLQRTFGSAIVVTSARNEASTNVRIVDNRISEFSLLFLGLKPAIAMQGINCVSENN